jgi:iron(III) transport system substrate-binding protein
MEGEVIAWTFTWQPGSPFEKRFKEKYPFLNLTIWDAPRATTAIAKQIEEAKVGRYSVDVVLYPAVDMSSAMEGGLLEDYDYPGTEHWSSQPSHKQFRNIAAGGRAPVYNTKLLTPSEVPKSWEDLIDKRWRGRSMISTSAREIPMGIAYVLGKGELDWEKSFSFWREVVEEARPFKVSGFSAPMQRVTAGEVPLFVIAALQTTQTMISRGAPLGIAPVEGFAALDAIALVKNAPHPNAAQLLIDFFASEGLVDYADTVRETVLDPELNKRTKTQMYYDRSGVKMAVLPVEFMTPENNKKSSDFWVKELHQP